MAGVDRLGRAGQLEDEVALPLVVEVGRPGGDEEIQDRAERVDVGPRIDGGPAELLRRGIAQRPQHDALARHQRAGNLDPLAQAEVEDFDDGLGVPRHRDEEDVTRLEVAVDDALQVGRRDRGAELPHDVQDRGLGQAAAHLDEEVERLAVQELHDHEVQARFGPEIDDADDVRVLHQRQHPRLAGESLDGVVIRLAIRQDRLDRDRPPQVDLGGPVDDAHSAFADLALDTIRPFEDAPDQRVGFLGGRHGRIGRMDRIVGSHAPHP